MRYAQIIPYLMLLQVSWVRHRDIHLLTVGRYTYTSDQRFRAIHHPHTEDWSLQIKYPQHRDSGIYECQISTTPHMSHFVHLNVIDTLHTSLTSPSRTCANGLHASVQNLNSTQIVTSIVMVVLVGSIPKPHSKWTRDAQPLLILGPTLDPPD
uniref:Ig-like domain-containing protein n=1 Tax=Anopheles culicifacies TaxID=139723 RepID=A0A182MC77_9DIPT